MTLYNISPNLTIVMINYQLYDIIYMIPWVSEYVRITRSGRNKRSSSTSSKCHWSVLGKAIIFLRYSYQKAVAPTLFHNNAFSYGACSLNHLQPVMSWDGNPPHNQHKHGWLMLSVKRTKSRSGVPKLPDQTGQNFHHFGAVVKHLHGNCSLATAIRLTSLFLE